MTTCCIYTCSLKIYKKKKGEKFHNDEDVNCEHASMDDTGNIANVSEEIKERKTTELSS